MMQTLFKTGHQSFAQSGYEGSQIIRSRFSSALTRQVKCECCCLILILVLHKAIAISAFIQG